MWLQLNIWFFGRLKLISLIFTLNYLSLMLSGMIQFYTILHLNLTLDQLILLSRPFSFIVGILVEDTAVVFSKVKLSVLCDRFGYNSNKGNSLY